MLYPAFHYKRHYLQGYLTFTVECLPRIRAEEKRNTLRKAKLVKQK